MNNNRRSRLFDALSIIGKAQSIIEDVKYEEEDSLANMPENLELSDRYIDMEDNVESMDSVLSNLEEATNEILSTIDRRS